MAVKIYKRTTNGRRNMSVLTFEKFHNIYSKNHLLRANYTPKMVA